MGFILARARGPRARAARDNVRAPTIQIELATIWFAGRRPQADAATLLLCGYLATLQARAYHTSGDTPKRDEYAELFASTSVQAA